MAQHTFIFIWVLFWSALIFFELRRHNAHWERLSIVSYRRWSVYTRVHPTKCTDVIVSFALYQDARAFENFLARMPQMHRQFPIMATPRPEGKPLEHTYENARVHDPDTSVPTGYLSGGSPKRFGQ